MSDRKSEPLKQQGQHNQQMQDPKRMGQSPSEPRKNEHSEKNQQNSQREKQPAR
jgi:hypothetical protein